MGFREGTKKRVQKWGQQGDEQTCEERAPGVLPERRRKSGVLILRTRGGGVAARGAASNVVDVGKTGDWLRMECRVDRLLYLVRGESGAEVRFPFELWRAQTRMRRGPQYPMSVIAWPIWVRKAAGRVLQKRARLGLARCGEMECRAVRSAGLDGAGLSWVGALYSRRNAAE